MKHILILLAAGLLLVIGGCGKPEAKSRPEIVAGLPPVADLAKRIAGADVSVSSALPPGRSPHDFSPHPAAIRDISGAKVYFYTGMPFEKNIARAVEGSPVKAINVASEIKRIPLEGGCCDHDHEGHDHAGHDDHADADELDPHVWLSPANCRIIAGEIARTLEQEMPERASQIRANLAKLDAELDVIDREIKEKLAPYRNRTFFVHHPAFGYYAAAAGLKQQGIELGGRETSPARLAKVIRLAQENKVKTIFVQPQFNPAAAQALAQAIDGEAAELDPLAPDVLGNFRRLTDHIAKGFSHK